MKKSILLGASLVVLTSCQTPLKTEDSNPFRKPASADSLIEGSRKVLANIANPQVFNAQTCPAFVNKVTDYLYNLPADYFVPKTPEEVEKFKAHGIDLVDTIFKIRVALRERFQEFDSRNELTDACTQEVREGIQYARFAEEYVLEWLHQNKVLEFTKKPIMTNERPNTWTNPKFEGFELKTGDAMIIRGKSYVSAMIARIGDEEGAFSHLAIVAEDSEGKQYVVEALIQYGVTITPLAKWREQEDARVALYRQPDAELGKLAGRKIYKQAKAALDKGAAIHYDFAMDDNDYSSMFCSEVVKYAYDKASDGKFIVPKFRSKVTKFEGTDYLKSLGVFQKTLFAPYDIEVDPRFEFVAENRHYPLLRQVRMQDAVLQSVYSWMIQKKYVYKKDFGHYGKAYLAKFLRQFGFLKDTLPKYMPTTSVKTNVQFQAIATLLEKNIYAKEEAYYKEKGYLPSFTDLMAMNEEFRVQDCEKQELWIKAHEGRVFRGPMPKGESEFHWFFTSGKACK
jgi:hypothetical protein